MFHVAVRMLKAYTPDVKGEMGMAVVTYTVDLS